MATPPITPFGMHHIAIQCRDLVGMVRFYERVLRLRVDRRWPADAPDQPTGDRSVWLKLGTGVLALERCRAVPQPPDWQDESTGLHLLAVEISWQNRGVWLDHLEHCGIPVVFESTWTIYIRDPEGNRIGLSHFPFTADGVRTA
jgi:catechol 2,3-dioxygenase-like lactoylglutathione lyase family enzyme